MSLDFHFVASVIIASLIIGVILGFVVSDKQLRNASLVIITSIFRIMFKERKTQELPANPVETALKVLLTKKHMNSNVDPSGLEASIYVKSKLAQRFADQIIGVYLFGSRARGEHLNSSDVDIAVLVNNEKNHFMMKCKIIRVAFLYLLRKGLYLQIRVLVLNSQEERAYIYTLCREGVKV